MVVRTIYVVRHGFRGNWVQDPVTGLTSSHVPSPTGIPSDPALASYGVQQAHELADKLITLQPKISRIYVSPFYRCIETVKPFVDKLGGEAEIRGDRGLGEWYGTARFTHPTPARPELLKTFFPTYVEHNSEIPRTAGETIPQLHDRISRTVASIISSADRDVDQPEAILICTHAATIIAIGRALTGTQPADPNTDDFNTYTCGISKFVRKPRPQPPNAAHEADNGTEHIGGWECVMNGDCSHLTNGAERGWHFSGDETFISTAESDEYRIGSRRSSLAFLDKAGVTIPKNDGARKESKM